LRVLGTDPGLALRGVLGAMAMTGMRRVTSGLGLIHKPPPEQVATEGLPRLLARVAPEHHETAIELLHWGTGAVGGIGYGFLPAALRRRRWAGPVYGLAILSAFDAVIAPQMEIAAEGRTFSERLALAADHLLYGIVLGGQDA
jgi:hypothetical protein